jgi:hypothetical protein
MIIQCGTTEKVNKELAPWFPPSTIWTTWFWSFFGRYCMCEIILEIEWMWKPLNWWPILTLSFVNLNHCFFIDSIGKWLWWLQCASFGRWSLGETNLGWIIKCTLVVWSSGEKSNCFQTLWYTISKQKYNILWFKCSH